MISFRRFIVFRLPNFWLLLSLLLLILLYPLLKDLPEGRAAIAAFDVVILILALRASHAGFGETWLGYALALPAVLLQVIAAFDDNRDIYAASLIAGAIFHGFVVVNLTHRSEILNQEVAFLLRYMLADSVMTLDELFAAANLYILAAFIFAYIYTLIEFWYPASFIMNAANNPDGLIEYWELVYFSFTCLTSVGFGEITPNSNEVRSVVMVEQIAGVLYLALVISRLVTLQSRRIERRREELRAQRALQEEHEE